MPNYEIIRKRCLLKGTEVLFPATYVAEPGGEAKLIRHIGECPNRDASCAAAGCRFCSGDKDPFGG